MTTSASTTTTAPTTQNHQQATTTSTTRTKIRERYTPRHHDLLVAVPGPDGPHGCAVCAAVVDLEEAMIDCGVGPEHRQCHDDDLSDELPIVHLSAPC